jgi:hypothetical protein
MEINMALTCALLFVNGHFQTVTSSPMESGLNDDGNSNTSLEKWQEFLITPPSWERSTVEVPKVSQFFDCLPTTLFDDTKGNVAPPTDRKSGNSESICVPLAFSLRDPEYPREIETRAIQFTNLDSQTTAKELLEMLKSYGEVVSVELANIAAGSAIVRFYDVRVAQLVRRTRFFLRNRYLGVAYGPLLEITNPRKPPNNGTIVVFHLRKGVTDDALHKEFAQFGGIWQIRSAPGKLTQRFIEYYDIRAAQAAVVGMKGKKVFKSKISVEYSLPGGFKKMQDQVISPRLPTIERSSRSPTGFAISY